MPSTHANTRVFKSAFGMQMPGNRSQIDLANEYKYGFNGKENDNEVRDVTGSFQDYGMRMYDTRVARFFSEDPLTSSYPWYTPYSFAGNKPIWAVDLDGLEELYVNNYINANGQLYKTTIQKVNNINAGKLYTTIAHVTTIFIQPDGSGIAIYEGSIKGNITNTNDAIWTIVPELNIISNLLPINWRRNTTTNWWGNYGIVINNIERKRFEVNIPTYQPNNATAIDEEFSAVPPSAGLRVDLTNCSQRIKIGADAAGLNGNTGGIPTKGNDNGTSVPIPKYKTDKIEWIENKRNDRLTPIQRMNPLNLGISIPSGNLGLATPTF